MTGSVFVDTNVFVYARDTAIPHKQQRAEEWLRALSAQRTGRISVQVLQEYYVTVTRKLRPGLTAAEAREDVRDLEAWQPLSLTPELLRGAWHVEDRFGLSWWDSLIVAAALQLGCSTLLTEDLNSGQDYAGVVVVNPFEQPPPSM